MFPKYVRAGKKAKAEKIQDLRPVIIEGGVISRSWWGKAWNENLESYLDYSSLIERGRSSVRCGAIVDLQVSAGEIKALVQGSRAKPYAITITIKKLNRNSWNLVTSACEGKLGSLEELLAGKFPKALEETFMQRRTGLFPSPKEIEFECSCPDWASMCKHIAATLYGIGARFDEDPTLFFTLRGVDAADLIKRAESSKGEDPFHKASKKSSQTIEGVGRSAASDVDLAKKAASWRSDDAAATTISWEEGARMADVRKILKKQLKIDARSLPKKRPSTKFGAKNIAVKRKTKGTVKRTV